MLTPQYVDRVWVCATGSYSNLLGTEKKKGEAVPHRKWVGNISADGKQIIFVEGAVIKDVVFAGAHNLSTPPHKKGPIIMRL